MNKLMNSPNFVSGQEIPFEIIDSVRREDLLRYSKASGDPNLIHLDDEVAKKAGLPGVIAHGMLIAGWISERARRFLVAQGPYDLKNFRTRFKAMTFPGETIWVGGQVKSFADGKWILDLVARNDAGEVKCTASAEGLIQ